MTEVEKRIATVIQDHDAGLHDSIEETVEFIVTDPEIASALKLASQATGWSFPITYMIDNIG